VASPRGLDHCTRIGPVIIDKRGGQRLNDHGLKLTIECARLPEFTKRLWDVAGVKKIGDHPFDRTTLSSP